MLKSVIILVLVSFPLYGQESKPIGLNNPLYKSLIRRPVATPEEPEESSRESGYSFSSGIIDGQKVQTETIQYGNISFTSGTVGNKPFKVTTYSIGSDEDEYED